MIWNVPEIVSELSTLFELFPGDIIFTGTPAGVGPLRVGDEVDGHVAGLELLTHRIV
jgi:fumarylpyruvate hydrolase